MFNRFISNYFGFNRQQRNGLWVLLLISFLLLLIRIIYPHFIEPAPIVVENLPLFEQRLDSAEKAASTGYRSHPKTAIKKDTLFVFDPNTISKEHMLQLGFNAKTAAVFLKFRNKGMIFKQKTDLLKVYGISDPFYKRIEPYIVIQASGKPSSVTPVVRQKSEPPVSVLKIAPVELNRADNVQLISLKGIGPGYAARILKYRDLLGGYVHIEQLKEVYGFTDLLFEQIKPFVLTDEHLVKKIDLNKDSFKSINRHPYLSYEMTKLIFDWRRKTTITAFNLRDILKDEGLYRKLLPYLVFD